MSHTISPQSKTHQEDAFLTHSRSKKHENLTKPIRNAGFVMIWKFSALNKVRQNFNLVFEMKKVNTKYKVLAMWLIESFVLQKPHYA